MCGIFGYLRPELSLEARRNALTAMGRALRHRGPDDKGAWEEPASGIGLGHRRLSILDLSPLGRQPMHSASGRWVVAFNGEVYNFAALRQELTSLGHAFRGGSDTEVILAAVEQWGVHNAVQRFIGMFALALWDRDQGELYLVRDRLGIKPLYWGRLDDGGFVFASELHALRCFPGFDPAVSRPSLCAYLRFGYVPAPRTIHEQAWKLEPGAILRIPAQGEPAPRTFWSALDTASGPPRTDIPDMAAAVRHLTDLLADAVRLRLVADVPLGGFLSGGVDSSLITALMVREAGSVVRTFSIGFAEQEYDESSYARAVASHLGTNHTELKVGPDDLLAVLDHLPQLCDEPLADSSLIPTYVLCGLARQHVTVCLSGDGGDELFGGYTRYTLVPKLWNKLRLTPECIRKTGANLLNSIPASWCDSLGQGLRSRMRTLGARGGGADMVRKFSLLARAGNQPDLFRRVVAHWPDPLMLLQEDTACPGDVFSAPDLWPRGRGMLETMLYWDQRSFLVDDVLTKVDRASMAHGLEARVPLLDHRVVEFVWSLPAHLRIPETGRPKELLLQTAEQFLPQGFFDRPKQGFSLPVGAWMRKELRPWMEDLLSPARLRADGFFQPETVTRIWREHLQGRVNWHYPLWNLAVFQLWLDARRHEPQARDSELGATLT
jgi:asparagine synthase (glutamine-hydrolysing)